MDEAEVSGELSTGSSGPGVGMTGPRPNGAEITIAGGAATGGTGRFGCETGGGLTCVGGTVGTGTGLGATGTAVGRVGAAGADGVGAGAAGAAGAGADGAGVGGVGVGLVGVGVGATVRGADGRVGLSRTILAGRGDSDAPGAVESGGAPVRAGTSESGPVGSGAAWTIPGSPGFGRPN